MLREGSFANTEPLGGYRSSSSFWWTVLNTARVDSDCMIDGAWIFPTRRRFPLSPSGTCVAPHHAKARVSPLKCALKL
jgi:hypothetical protein